MKPEEFGTVDALDLGYTSILKTISIIDLTTPPPKFPSYFNLHNESIFLIFFKIIFHLIIITFAPSFCFRVALVNVYVTIEFSEDDSDEDDNLRSSFRRKLAI